MPRLVIKEVAKKRKVTQYRLALLLKMDMKNLARLLKPGSNPTFQTLCKVAKALKCRVRDLIKG